MVDMWGNPESMANWAWGQRYSGMAAAALNTRWDPVDPYLQMMEENARREREMAARRAREEAAARAQAAAAARAAAQAESFRPTVPGYVPMGQPVTPGQQEQGVGGTVASWVTDGSPSWANAALDVVAGPPDRATGEAPTPNKPYMMPPDANEPAAATQPGSVQDWARPYAERLLEAIPNAVVLPNDPVDRSDPIIEEEYANTVDTVGQADEQDKPPVTEALSPQERAMMMQSMLPTSYSRVQERVFGTPDEVTDPATGQKYLVYNTKMPKFLGYDKEMQQFGWLPTAPLPKPPAQDAPEKDWIAYADKVRNSIRVPEYRVGSQYTVWNNMPRAEVIRIQKMMKAAGGYSSTDYYVPGKVGPAEMAIMTSWMREANVRGVGWERVAQIRAKAAAAMRARSGGYGGGGGGGGGSSRSVNIQYAQTSIAQARTLMSSVLRDALGRPPTAQELSTFLARLNAAEDRSPTRTVTNYVREGTTTTATSQVNPSEVDPEQMAREFAMELNGGKEFSGYQTNNYMDMLVRMLMGAQNV